MSIKAFCEDHVALAKLVLIGLMVQLAVIAYVFYSGYQRRVDTVTFQRAACERGKLDRGGSAVLSTSILVAFEDTDKRFPGPNTKDRNETEDAIKSAADGFTKRSKIDCEKVFPDATLFP